MLFRSPSRGAAGAQLPTPAATRSGVCSSRDALSHAPCLSPCLLPCCFLLCFLKQTETIRFEKFSELADAHRQNSSRGSCSGDHYCCGSPSEEVRQRGSPPLVCLESILLVDPNSRQFLPGRANSSLRRVSSFSSLSSPSRAASHSSRVPVLCVIVLFRFSGLIFGGMVSYRCCRYGVLLLARIVSMSDSNARALEINGLTSIRLIGRRQILQRSRISRGE